jgi:cytochrome c-type biogenesis protein
MVASVQDTLLEGQVLLAAYSAGLAVPFLLAAVATGRFVTLSRRFRRVAPIAEKLSGVVLILVGLLLISGSFTALSALLARYTPEFLLERL